MKYLVALLFTLSTFQILAQGTTEEQRGDRKKGTLASLGIISSEVHRKIALENPGRKLKKTLDRLGIEDQVQDYLRNVKYKDQLEKLERVEKELLKPTPYPKTIPKFSEISKVDEAFLKNFEDIKTLNSRISQEAKGLTQVISAQAELGGINLRFANVEIKSDVKGVEQRTVDQKASAQKRAVKRIKTQGNVLLIAYGAYMIYLTVNDTPAKKDEGEKKVTKSISISGSRNPKNFGQASRLISEDLFITESR